jgi:amino acid transporter
MATVGLFEKLGRISQVDLSPHGAAITIAVLALVYLVVQICRYYVRKNRLYKTTITSEFAASYTEKTRKWAVKASVAFFLLSFICDSVIRDIFQQLDAEKEASEIAASRLAEVLPYSLLLFAIALGMYAFLGFYLRTDTGTTATEQARQTAKRRGAVALALAACSLVSLAFFALSPEQGQAIFTEMSSAQ